MLPCTIWDGRRISAPGLYARVPMSSYHLGNICDGPSVSSTGLRTMFHKGPSKFWCESPLNPRRVEPTEKDHFVLGRCAHHLVLGEPFFAKLFVIRPDEISGKKYHWNNAGWIKWYAEQKQAGRTVLVGEQVENIRGMAMSLGRYPLVQQGLLNGQIERSIFWKDKETGIWLKCRPDAIPNDSGDFADLKTTRDVSFKNLKKTIDDYSYYQQAALIRRACREVLGIEMNSFTLLFVESKPPYDVDHQEIKSNDLDLGEECNQHALRALWRCLRDKHFPGPSEHPRNSHYIEIPDRARERAQAILQNGIVE